MAKALLIYNSSYCCIFTDFVVVDHLSRNFLLSWVRLLQIDINTLFVTAVFICCYLVPRSKGFVQSDNLAPNSEQSKTEIYKMESTKHIYTGTCQPHIFWGKYLTSTLHQRTSFEIWFWVLVSDISWTHKVGVDCQQRLRVVLCHLACHLS